MTQNPICDGCHYTQANCPSTGEPASCWGPDPEGHGPAAFIRVREQVSHMMDAIRYALLGEPKPLTPAEKVMAAFGRFFHDLGFSIGWAWKATWGSFIDGVKDGAR